MKDPYEHFEPHKCSKQRDTGPDKIEEESKTTTDFLVASQNLK